MGEKKVVIDTNVVISGFGWKGPPYRILQLAFDQKIEWCICKAQVDEIARVLSYPHLKFEISHQQSILDLLFKTVHVVEIAGDLDVVDDPTDNVILETALVAKADFLITGDQHLLKFNPYSGMKIVKPADFLNQLRIDN